MRTSKFSGWLGGAVLATLCAAPSTAHAQADTEPPLPNVMLLIDTSGSMEYMMGVNPVTKQPVLPKCYGGDPAQPNEQNRWTTLAAVLTGEFPQFACSAESRSTTAFNNEFSINGQSPYDKDYYLPYNRIVSVNPNTNERCVTGPDTNKWPGANPYVFQPDAIRTHPVGNAGVSCAKINGSFRLFQADDGLLDVFNERARFGLMTFDSLPDRRTGVNGLVALPNDGFQGHWSYYPGWDQNGGGFATGKPELCDTAQEIEVGARNPSAPPWEGRMFGFGKPTSTLSEVVARNEQIQQAILAVRPYGATPMAGLLDDAEYFFTSDTTTDKTDTVNNPPFGPRTDPYVLGGCRKQFVILLTDGVPNLDLREGCKNNAPGPPDGTCPFSSPADTAKRLANPANVNNTVRTFVVGFAFSSAETAGPVPLDCKTLTGQNDAACVSPASESVRACCEMAKVAYNGKTGAPRFADNKQELRKALNDILSEVSQNTTSRTTPVFASAGAAGGGYSGGDNKVAGYNILSSFKVSTGGLWTGVLERQRYVCDKSTGVYSVIPKDISETSGDSFNKNMASGLGPERLMFTVIPSSGAQQSKIEYTLRNSAGITDGLGSLTSSTLVAPMSSFNSVGVTDAMNLAVGGVPQSVCGTLKTPVSVADCRSRLLRWYVGLPPIDSSPYTRQSPLGSIFHATPTVVGPPSEFLRDESYTAFAELYKNRVPIVYAATTDGQLHAFKLGPADATDTAKVDNKNNNVLWSFVPPSILPDIKSIYPGVERRLLDTPLVTRDVVFERSRASALSGTGATDWKTVLVTGFGPTQGGYFGLDVTNPVYAPPTGPGPKWLWQVSSDAAGLPLFGASGTASLGSIYMKGPNMSEAREVAVAILPGGASAATSGACARAQAGAQTVDGKWKFRGNVRCYADDDASRSVTIVRLDTGEVVRRFHRCKSNGQPPRPYDAALVARSACVPFDSPITSVPMAYPNGTGQSATRAFVGDQDGAMWRIDLSSINPTDWKVEPFFDSYAPYTADSQIGQPIVSQPVASLDSVGNLVLAFSTGNQDRFEATPGMRNVIWSVSEAVDVATGKVGAKANWHLGTGNNEVVQATPNGSATGNWNDGIRVSGPLSLFGGAIYFSTYRPPTANSDACDPGSSVLWAVDYLKNTANDLLGDAAPVGALPPQGGVVYGAKAYSNALIFGVGIQKLPACYDTSTVNDPYIGYGGTGSTSVSELTKPDYKLVVQTGAKGAQQGAAETKFETLSLVPPPSGGRISSWASVVE